VVHAKQQEEDNKQIEIQWLVILYYIIGNIEIRQNESPLAVPLPIPK